MDQARDAFDNHAMARCVELARTASEVGEYPYASVVALDGEIVAEALNHTFRDKDLSRHAEIVALAKALQTIGAERLRSATLYSVVEPCAMCSYCIREAGLRRVVYALGSPVMGGNSHWNILRDDEIAKRIPLIFAPAPEVVEGVLASEARRAWREWSPVASRIVELSGILVELDDHDGDGDHIKTAPAQTPSFMHYFKGLFEMTRSWRKGGRRGRAKG